MKTEVAKVAACEKTSVKSMEERVVVQGARRSLHPLQIAASDKENLVGAGRLGVDMPPNKEKLSTPSSGRSSELVSVKKLKTSKNSNESRTVTVDDLTSEEAPSTSYWQQLCESQRTALDAALSENKDLHERVKLLEEENEQCRVLLEETKALVDTLKEMMCEQDEESAEEE